jgi:hypothetical protein
MKRCSSCDIELPGQAVIVAGRAYCCSGCSAGGPCCCTYEGEGLRPATNGHVDPLLTELLGGLSPDERPGTWDR